ncbi:MAG: 2,3-bisphosphoglycerate-independent phosphoglycerate mutase [Candidatus Yanofskybacteria bacterium GW2011_GWA1_44_21]|uniref:2,3-bisphosphoglycerate-independent phosphoglycerate mutase n=2 Tax=Candidatus Yanofskyibacteriota TaxID=1752733 RepID=A0A1F8GZK8_9BACT|nr:MAG: 2,3-bisphosphoglycerate-independent phosphoglycerate mutase [Candidatus Yanofskybacteria bacterium GW2011_GWA2_44_10]KKT50088.1 MAG: 2,3-bisphosphoglycerate-independent phosphoglycerate mutase [Candidatus Yanofskybacteria bacterium GW2011_GWA1_44_21]KKT89880.1 MAG: 2,3-bisphosphoglycerate-independent phosphoglycerate mutase [Candidatus Yanofskybacteria bacterium GW2011_GWB1_45_11]OGN02840.1 MAG: phosphoglycerate mutase (2,3-diphosphoglycerate-independent) [Candidatus Yanofskybacteria bac
MKPVVLLILDGWGYSRETIGNAIANANLPIIRDIESKYPSLLLQASGPAVGLTHGESGNSEVGHLTIGAGRVIFQYLDRINKSIRSGDFFENPVFVEAANHVKTNNSKMHLVGLLGSNSVHSHISHIFALIDLAKKNGLSNVYLHLFTDGKDSGLEEAPELIERLNKYILDSATGSIATIVGRDIAMDRNNNWDLISDTCDLLIRAKGEKISDPAAALKLKYESGYTDINMVPMVINPEGKISDNDSVIFFNFREDRMRQLVSVFVKEDFKEFNPDMPRNLFIAGMTQYIEPTPNFHVAFPLRNINNSLPEVISKNGLKQLHIAETEKYAHVTYFFHGLRDLKLDGEEDVLIKSDRNPTENPRMKCDEITSHVVKSIESDAYDFMLINFANPDMLAHMGVYDQVVKGLEAVDENVGKIRDAVLAKNGFLIVTSDHGNAEQMVYKSGEPETRHNPSPVPIYFISGNFEGKTENTDFNEPGGFLSDIAPTVLEILGIQKPVEMTGESLLKLIQ